MPYHFAMATALLQVLLPVATPTHADFGLPGGAVEFDGWRYIPIFENGAVHSFVVLDALPDPLGRNIASMWFIRAGDHWVGNSWRTSDQKAALVDVKHTLGLSDETDRYWPVDSGIQPSGASPSTLKEPLAIGVFPNDPLLPMIESAGDPTEVLSVLVSTGWEASDAAVFKSECHRDQLLGDMADGFVLALAGDASGVDVIADAIDATLGEGREGGGTPIACTPNTIFDVPFESDCISLGWTLSGTTTIQASGGACWIQNSWTGRRQLPV